MREGEEPQSCLNLPRLVSLQPPASSPPPSLLAPLVPTLMPRSGDLPQPGPVLASRIRGGEEVQDRLAAPLVRNEVPDLEAILAPPRRSQHFRP